jgi:AraC-like DNA-binding protein
MSTTPIYEALVHSTFARDYENAFQQATSLPIKLVPSDAVSGFFSSKRRGNAFCRLMAQFPGCCTACEQVHIQLQQQTADSLAPQIVSCFAGLAEFAVPVVVDGQHVATLCGGQVFQRRPTQAQFVQLKQYLRTWGLQSELSRVENLFFQTQVVPRKQFQASVRLLTIFTKLLADDVNRGLLTAQVHDRPCITTAKNFILAHASEPLQLHDVAEHIHISAQYFCKFFKKATGIGFSEFLARVRVQIAKNSLADPALPIIEVANQAGFGSLSQFNRTFHRYVGCSPKAYRASLPQAPSR